MFTYFKQTDDRWKDQLLGQGPATIGAAGCYLTAFACFANPHHLEVDPGTLNSLFNDRKQYVDCGPGDVECLPDSALQKVFPELQLGQVINCQETPAPLDQLSADENQAVFVELQRPGRVTHFCPVAENREGDPLIFDVFDGVIKPISQDWGDAKEAIVKIIHYAAPAPKPAPAPAPAPPEPVPTPAPTPAPVASLEERGVLALERIAAALAPKPAIPPAPPPLATAARKRSPLKAAAKPAGARKLSPPKAAAKPAAARKPSPPKVAAKPAVAGVKKRGR